MFGWLQERILSKLRQSDWPWWLSFQRCYQWRVVLCCRVRWKKSNVSNCMGSCSQRELWRVGLVYRLVMWWLASWYWTRLGVYSDQQKVLLVDFKFSSLYVSLIMSFVMLTNVLYWREFSILWTNGHQNLSIETVLGLSMQIGRVISQTSSSRRSYVHVQRPHARCYLIWLEPS